MTEYLSPSEIDKRLGLIPPEEEPEEIVIKGIHAKRVAPTKKRRPENSAAKAASTKQENDGKAISEELQAARDGINELRATVAELQDDKAKAETAREELKTAKDEIAELKANLEEAKEEANNRFEAIETELNEVTEPQEKKKVASLCPSCGKDVGWDSLAVIEGYPDEEGINPMAIFYDPVKCKRCPECAYYERINEVMQQLEQKAEEETVGEDKLGFPLNIFFEPEE